MGSSSIGRQWVLKTVGLPFSARKSSVNENDPASENIISKPMALRICESNAKMKMDFLVHNLCFDDYTLYYGLLTVDTIIWLPPHHYIGKADTIVHAKKFLTFLNGKSHSVITTFNFLPFNTNGTSSTLISGFEETIITFADISPLLLDKYLVSGECLGRAGGYALQGMGVLFVKHIDGDFYNVVGIPISKILESIRVHSPSWYEEILTSICFSKTK